MKRIISYMLAATTVLAVGCKPNYPLPGTMDIPVDKVILLDELADGEYEMEAGETLMIEGLVSVLPENATDLAQVYFIEDQNPTVEGLEVASVVPQGAINALNDGTCTVYVYVGSGNKYASFNLTVRKETKPITSITGKDADVEYTGGQLQISALNLFAVEPGNQNEGVTYTCENSDVVSIDGETVTITGITPASGIRITATSASGSKTATAFVKAYRWESNDLERFEGELAGNAPEKNDDRRYYMSMTCSQNPLAIGGMANGRNNSLTAMLDGRHIVNRVGTGSTNDENLTNGTAFTLVVPGKSTGGVTAPANSDIYFIIDLCHLGNREASAVNYFRIYNISDSKDDMVVRFKAFSEISGSNSLNDNGDDLESPEVIAINLTFDNATPGKRETENIPMTTETPKPYRYLKFLMKGNSCYGPAGKTGTTAQIDEFYLGLRSKVYADTSKE